SLSVCPALASCVFASLSLHDALPICVFDEELGTRCELASIGHPAHHRLDVLRCHGGVVRTADHVPTCDVDVVLQQECDRHRRARSEEHTSELQSRFDLVCRLLIQNIT